MLGLGGIPFAPSPAKGRVGVGYKGQKQKLMCALATVLSAKPPPSLPLRRGRSKTTHLTPANTM